MYKIQFATELIKAFFIELNNKNISYIVLRNYEGLPEENSSKDVDILLNENSVTDVESLLINLSKALEYDLVWKNRLDYLTGFAFVKVVDEKIFSIKIDLFNGFKWRGINYIDENFIFNSKKKYDILFSPNKSHESFIMILYYILYAKNIKNKYFENIYQYKNDFQNFKLIANKSLNEGLTNQIIEKLNSNDIENLIDYRNKIISSIFRKNINKTLKTIKNIFMHLYYEIINRNKLGTLIVLNQDYDEKELLIKLFLDLGIGYEHKETEIFSIFSLFKKLRSNMIIVLHNNDLTWFQRRIFTKKIVTIKNYNIENIFSKLEKFISKGLQ